MENEKYNGWSNYETWKINLELISDYADSLISQGERFQSVKEIADLFEQYANDIIDESTGYAVDLAISFISDVNWKEIADSYAEDLIECDENGERVDNY